MRATISAESAPGKEEKSARIRGLGPRDFHGVTSLESRRTPKKGRPQPDATHCAVPALGLGHEHGAIEALIETGRGRIEEIERSAERRAGSQSGPIKQIGGGVDPVIPSGFADEVQLKLTGRPS